MDAVSPKIRIAPFSLRDAPALMERVWPAQKISVETKREFDAHGAQTLTPLGNYWKGRKRLVYVRACVLGALLPLTDDPETDLSVFEKLMAIDDEAFLHRENKLKPTEVAKLAIKAGAIQVGDLSDFWRVKGKSDATPADFAAALDSGKLVWSAAKNDVDRLRLAALGTLSYEDKVSRSLRPEELPDEAYAGIWTYVNNHLGTSANSHRELVEQLGIMRFGHRPMVADIFCGAGSIPFEAARLGCDVYASDLNPIACMLTWGALHLIGGGDRMKATVETAQKSVTEAVDRQLIKMGIEHDKDGNRTKAYLYCVEVKCPATGWIVPLLPSLIVSRIKRTIVRLVPNRSAKRFDLEVVPDATPAEMESAKLGTVRNKNLHYELDGEVYRTPIATIRGESSGRGANSNGLRRWTREDIVPRKDDVFGERLYCIQWMRKETLDRSRPETFFRAPDADDLRREKRVFEYVRDHLADWQSAGFVPDMVIEPGENTSQPIKERGWSHWHHLFTPRQLLIGALLAQQISQVPDDEVRACLTFDRTFVAHNSARLSQWLPGTPGKPGVAPSADTVKHVFYNQALNTFYNFGCRAFFMVKPDHEDSYTYVPLHVATEVITLPAGEFDKRADLFITDPPYADAVNYHEITEFFIAWLRRNPPKPFADWIWDSRRALAVRGTGEEFRTAMVEAYRRAAERMPDNGLQIVMFTHQDAQVWADMALIFWGAGLQVMSAWYVSTETTSETKKGGYVQGTVTIVLRKRGGHESGYKDEIVQEVKAEVAEQIDTMVGLNQNLKGHGRIENLFEDADLQMAGYAAALRVLTKYEKIDGIDMTKAALRAGGAGEVNVVGEIIDFAVQVANEHMVPDGMEPKLWESVSGPERFYFKMMDVETTSLRKLDNYQNFSKAFRVGDYGALMGSMEPNKASLKTAKEFKKVGFEIPEFGPSATRAVLYAIYELESEVDGDEVLSHLRDMLPSYHSKRDDLATIAEYIARKREKVDETESRAARILHGLIRNERLG
ncbi:DNA methylase [Bradyrhizobium sp. CCBAU 21362]|uniref:anti-phage-associated DUF1156 domain-containing protein n=1 Tax=Bradyrhizobium sp. CCBAU 21362 TaxID=1325082 RepID=UPI00230626F4|nr:anti-phage-associated DUF1156 domain-containing protein [Bradyrhizobium sp. CCBAU 21362]MDA9542282.1 DNA methylase [Bradyrhizobium sp. CCBAU 21362]